MPGDDPRLVDWRAYARFGRLVLKQQEEERARTIRILIDASASMDWGDGDAHKGRFARCLAAAITWIAVSHHETVALWLLRDGAARRLPPVSTPASAVLCFRELDAMQEDGRMGLAAAVCQALSYPGSGPTLLVSDLMEPSWPDTLAALPGTREATVVQVLAPFEWAPPVGEEVELVDAESGDTLPTRLGTPELSAYARRLDSFLEDVAHECRRLGLPYIALNTETPLQDVLFRQLPAAGILE